MDEAGEALWRKLVEKKFLNPEEKKRPVFKVIFTHPWKNGRGYTYVKTTSSSGLYKSAPIAAKF